MAWAYETDTRRYRDLETGRFLSASAQVELRDDLAQMVTAGDLTPGAWEIEMRARVKLVTTTQYAFGRGGVQALTHEDRVAIGALGWAQFGFLHVFAGDIADGGLSAAQTAARAQLYFGSATSAYEQGPAAAHGGLVLPHYPGDGSTACLGNCRCHVSVNETDDAWEATWHTAGNACAGCASRAAEWSPLVVPK